MLVKYPSLPKRITILAMSGVVKASTLAVLISTHMAIETIAGRKISIPSYGLS
jgi:hypothetical protein